MTNCSMSNKIKAEAKRLGFFACGIAKAEPVESETAYAYHQWLAEECHADMEYLANNIEKRLDPTALMPEAKSIICVALNYTPKQYLPDTEYQFAAYAFGQDYHDVMKNKLRLLASTFSLTAKICCDTVPILERYWAEKAGLGWIGRNHQLIIPKAGSMFFLGEIITDMELEYDKPTTNKCGNCHACTDICPTGAISLNSKTFIANKCISYLTIENRNVIPEEYKKAIGNSIYGCDRCQKVCPHNHSAKPTEEVLLQPKDDFLAMRKEDWHNLSLDKYRNIFKDSAVKRVKYEGLIRNIKIAEDNSK